MLAEKHLYRPSATALAMRDQRTRQIGIMLRNAPDRPNDNPSAFEMILSINMCLASEGYIVSLIRIGEVGDLHHDSRVFREHVLDGMIVSGPIPNPILQRVRELVPQCIFADCNMSEPERCIQRDEFAAGQLCAQALVDAGYRRLSWLGPLPTTTTHYSVNQRYAGVQAVAAQAGVELVHHTPPNVRETDWPPFIQLVQQNCQPTLGVVSYNQETATQWATVAMNNDLTPPRNYGLVSCDGSAATTVVWPGLARANFDQCEMGVQAADMLFRLLHSPNLKCPSRKIPVQWIPGQTIMSPPPSDPTVVPH